MVDKSGQQTVSCRFYAMLVVCQKAGVHYRRLLIVTTCGNATKRVVTGVMGVTGVTSPPTLGARCVLGEQSGSVSWHDLPGKLDKSPTGTAAPP